MIPISMYRRIVHLIDTSGASNKLDELLYPNRQGRRGLPTRTFLIAAMLSIQRHRSMRYQDIYHLLTRELPPEAMLDLKVAVRATNEHGQPVARLVCTIDQLYNYTRRLRERVGGDGPIATDTHSLLLDVIHRIIDAGLPPRPEGATAYAIDESGTWAYSRRRHAGQLPGEDDNDVDDYPFDAETLAGHADEVINDTDTAPPKQLTASVDPDAANGNKTAKSGRQEPYFGYGIHGLVRAPRLGTDGSSEPLLVERIDLVPASTDVVEPSLRMIDSLMAKPGAAITELLGDRHYSYKDIDRWFRQLHERGIRQVVDLRADEQGFHDLDGMRVVGSTPHCPATPDHLASIPRPQPPTEKSKRAGVSRGTKAQRERAAAEEAKRARNYRRRRDGFEQRIAERQAYAMQRITGLDGSKIRYRCPALNGTVGCPLREGTVEVARKLGLPIVDNPPDLATAPASCTQKTVTVKVGPDHLNPKHLQEHYWGSKQWEASYRRRTYVEGFFGTMKDAATENISRHGSRGDRLGLRLLYIGLGMACSNLRLLRKWHDEHRRPLDVDPVLLEPDEYPIEFPLTDEEDSAA